MLPDVKTIMDLRLRMGEVYMKDEAVLLRVATLRVTLGLALQKLLLAGLHFRSTQVDMLLVELQGRLNNASKDVNERLGDCIEFCSSQWNAQQAQDTTQLIDLLCGIPESSREVNEQRFPQVVTVQNSITAPLEVLLRDGDMNDPANALHHDCQSLFKNALRKYPRVAVTAGKVLELAYLWVLACRSKKFREILLHDCVVRFQCQTIQIGYIFERHNEQHGKRLDLVEVAKLQVDTLYYAEGNHPCADLFFKDNTNLLYLVDIGGTSNVPKARRKVQKMNEVIVQQNSRKDLGGIKLKGVVLLPNILQDEENDKPIMETIVVTGEGARGLLGGLVQLLSWLPDV